MDPQVMAHTMILAQSVSFVECPDYAMEEAVRRGVAFLDETYPGWRALVRWERLDMNQTRFDVLSMVDPALVTTDDFDVAHGFLIPFPLGCLEEPWLRLTETWRRLGRTETGDAN